MDDRVSLSGPVALSCSCPRRHRLVRKPMRTSTASSPLATAQMRDLPSGSGWTAATRQQTVSRRIRSRMMTRCGFACEHAQGSHVYAQPAARNCFCPVSERIAAQPFVATCCRKCCGARLWRVRFAGGRTVRGSGSGRGATAPGEARISGRRFPAQHRARPRHGKCVFTGRLCSFNHLCGATPMLAH